MLLLRCFSVAVLLVTALPAAAAPESPSPSTAAPTPAADPAIREQVRGLVRQAGESMDRGDRAHAAVLLEQARRLRPDPSLDYNLGITYTELNQGPEAAHAFGRFVTSADPSRVLPERLADGRKRLAEYERSLGRLRLRISSPAGGGPAILYLDDRPSSITLAGGALPSDINPLWLRPGPHRLRVTSSGLRDYQVAIELAPGESREVTGELYRDDIAVGLLHDLPTPPKEPPPLYKKWWFWTAIGAGTVTVVSLIAAGAAGSFSHTASGSDLDSIDLAITVGRR